MSSEVCSNTRDADLASVIGLEQQLLHPQARLDAGALAALLHHDFLEFGASGRSYDRKEVIEALTRSDGGSLSAAGFHARRLGPDAILLTYYTDTPSLRTSVWVRNNPGPWRIVHHQGTSITGETYSRCLHQFGETLGR